VGWRADIFTNWGAIQPLAELRASTNPRVYQRDLTSAGEFAAVMRTLASKETFK
jgi:hypothetical protein